MSLKTFTLKAGVPLTNLSFGAVRFINPLVMAGELTLIAYPDKRLTDKLQTTIFKGMAINLERDFGRFELISPVDQTVKIWFSKHNAQVVASELRSVGSENISAGTAVLDYTKPLELAPAEPGRGRVIIQPKTDCYVGAAGLTPDNAIKLDAGERLALNTQGAIYGLSLNPDHKVTYVPSADSLSFQHDIESPYRYDGQYAQIGGRIYKMMTHNALQSGYSDDNGKAFLPLPSAGAYTFIGGDSAGAWGIVSNSYDLHIYTQDETSQPVVRVLKRTDIDAGALSLECAAITQGGNIAITGMVSGGRRLWVSMDGGTSFQRVQHNAADFVPQVYYGLCAVGEGFAAASADFLSMCFFNSADIGEEVPLDYPTMNNNKTLLCGTDEGVVYYFGRVLSDYDQHLCWVRLDSGGGVTKGKENFGNAYNKSAGARSVAASGSAVMFVNTNDSFGQGGEVYYKPNHAADFALIAGYDKVVDNLESPRTLHGGAVGQALLAGTKYLSGELLPTGGGKVSVIREVN